MAPPGAPAGRPRPGHDQADRRGRPPRCGARRRGRPRAAQPEGAEQGAQAERHAEARREPEHRGHQPDATASATTERRDLPAARTDRAQQRQLPRALGDEHRERVVDQEARHEQRDQREGEKERVEEVNASCSRCARSADRDRPVCASASEGRTLAIRSPALLAHPRCCCHDDRGHPVGAAEQLPLRRREVEHRKGAAVGAGDGAESTRPTTVDVTGPRECRCAPARRRRRPPPMRWCRVRATSAGPAGARPATIDVERSAGSGVQETPVDCCPGSPSGRPSAPMTIALLSVRRRTRPRPPAPRVPG